MQITEARIKLMENRNDRLKAFCSITFDNDFVIRDLNIIEGTNGFFVAMPSRKLTDHCPSCKGKNHLRAHYCNDCGKELPEQRTQAGDSQVPKLHADIAHPVNSQTRQTIQNSVVEAYQAELHKAKPPTTNRRTWETWITKPGRLRPPPHTINRQRNSRLTPTQTAKTISAEE